MITALACLLLASCASTRSDREPAKELATPAAQPPGPLEKGCARPARLAGKAMSAGEVERQWGRDRVSLAACAGRHAALIKWRRARDAGLAGQPLPEPPKEPEEPGPVAAEPAFRNPLAGLFGGE
jgi:hypothetical protein